MVHGDDDDEATSAWQRFGGRHEAIWREDRELTRGSHFWRETVPDDLLARNRHFPCRKR